MAIHPHPLPMSRAATVRARDREAQRGWALPGWLIFFLLGMAAITAGEVLPGSSALLAFAGTLAAP